MYIEEETFSSRLDWSLWRQIFKHALPYKRYLIGLSVGAVVIAVCDASFILVTRWAIDDVTQSEGPLNVFPYMGVYMALATLLGLGVWSFIIFAGSLSHHMSHDIRRATFTRIQELELSYFDHRPTGWLISRLTSDCDKLSRIIAWSFLDIVWASSLVTAISVILLFLNLKLGLIVLMVVPPLVLISAWFQKRLLLSSRETRKVNSFITAAFSEGLQGLKTTKTFVREEANLDEFKGLSDSMYDWSVRNAVQSAVFIPIVLTIGSVAAGSVLWIGGGDYLAGALSLGTLVAFIYYAGQFFDPVNQIAAILVQLQGAQAAGERVLNLLATEPGIKDSPAVLKLLELEQSANIGSAPDGLQAEIKQVEFRHVSFAYEANEPVLEDFNLLINPGETIALVGASGGGKSTIVSLLARFYEPTSGGIYVDGIEYRERSLDWYQSNLGIVLQSPHLFAGTVGDNIRYGRLDATEAEIEEAAHLVNAHSFIAELEQGYNTPVGEGGNRLSTGQKQLVSFARAILANPQIFIMDEATSSIDTETEALIQSGMRAILRGRISFVIAHRLSTIRSADRILVIDRGKILESGSHNELISRRGHYHALYTRQFRQETEATVLDRVGS